MNDAHERQGHVRLADPMAPRTTTLRFDAAAHELVKAAAEACGVTTAQFMREAALVRAVLTLRTDIEHLTPQTATEHIADFDALSAEVARLAQL